MRDCSRFNVPAMESDFMHRKARKEKFAPANEGRNAAARLVFEMGTASEYDGIDASKMSCGFCLHFKFNALS